MHVEWDQYPGWDTRSYKDHLQNGKLDPTKLKHVVLVELTRCWTWALLIKYKRFYV